MRLTCRFSIRAMFFAILILSLGGVSHAADRYDEPVPGIVHLLGYIGVDYPGTVRDGKVTVPTEYAEQREFAGRVHLQIGTLANVPEKSTLLKQAVELERLIERKVEGQRVAALTDRMRAQLIKAYQVSEAPRHVPNLIRGAALYAEHCAGCHGAQGRGDGPQAMGLQPAPADFQLHARQDQRSVYALFNALTLGVQGTAMQGYAKTLNEADRWALAFVVANFLASQEDRQAGAALWSDRKFREQFNNLRRVTSLSPHQADALGSGGAKVLAWLRSQPQVLGNQESPLEYSWRLLEESLLRYRQGQFDKAYGLAVTAYVEGFELVETGLTAVNPELKRDLERELYDYRNLIKKRAPEAELVLALAHIEAQYKVAHSMLGSANLTPGVAYTSSLVILLREGLEAILLLAVVVAFLIKTGRRDALKYIHVGWLAALLLGGVTWVAATTVVNISGASRELTEGITALIAAAILIYVGFWLHNKLQAQRWKAFIETRVQGALDNGTLWSITLVAFIAVYREVFETVLFYQTLWVQAGAGGQHMVLMGFLSAVAGLVVLAWLIFKFSVRLPLRWFFAINSVLLYLLAVVFAGKGVAALQEAGVVPVENINFPTIDVLGIYPNLQSLSLQALLVLAAAVFVMFSRRKPVA